MTNSPISTVSNTVATGGASNSVFIDVYATRDPTTNDVQYQLQKKWLNTSTSKYWILESFSSAGGVITANWISIGGSAATETVTCDTGVATPVANNVNLLGSGSITTIGSGSTATVELQNLTNHNVLVGAGTTTITKVPPSTAGFILTSNGAAADPSFQAASASGAITTITGNSGGAEVPTAGGNFNVLGTGSITVAGSANTETVQLTGLTNHNVLIGAGTATVTNVAPSATSGVPLISQGAAADPTFGTAVVAGGGTGNTSATAYAVLCGGTTSTAPFQSVASVGTTGQILTSNGAGALPTFQSTPALAIQVAMQVFTSSGTYTPTAGMQYCQIVCVGGGGAGGGAAATDGTHIAFGGGGGAGEVGVGIFSAATIGVSQTVTIGTAGAGVSGASGGNGGTTSVGILLTANGGSGGNTLSTNTINGTGAGAGGTGGTGGSYHTPGAIGIIGWGNATAPMIYGGEGASGSYGEGGGGKFPNSTSGSDGAVALGYGAGGSGAANSTSQSAHTGGNGTAGIVIITEYI